MVYLIRSEMYRIFHKKSNIAIIVISVLMLLLLTLFLKYYGAVLYNPKNGPQLSMEVNRYNLPSAILANLDLIINFIITPFFISSLFNGEMRNGSLRLVALRPYTKAQIILGKIISSIIFDTIYVTIIFITSIIYSLIYFPPIKYAKFFFIERDFNFTGSLVYNFKYYLVFLIVMILVSMLATAISLITPNVILSIIVNIAVMIGTIYFSKEALAILMYNSCFIYDVLGGKIQSVSIILIVIADVIIGLFIAASSRRLEYI